MITEELERKKVSILLFRVCGLSERDRMSFSDIQLTALDKIQKDLCLGHSIETFAKIYCRKKRRISKRLVQSLNWQMKMNLYRECPGRFCKTKP